MVRVQSENRASSARPQSAARTVVRKRDKPYRTEQSRVVERKKKLQLQTTFSKPPPGFVFLPVGTPDLADRCKELSRLRSLPVNIVNGDPLHKNATDETKVSHHILRVGYHFKAEVVNDACHDLGYVYSQGKFLREEEHATQSILARTMRSYGLKPVPGAGLESKNESSDQIRAAIKELFPKMPDDDLQYILDHAWEKGSKRVGTAAMLTLPRRVQLATIARIRHHYTDYDRLLRAFDWGQARLMIEPTCVQKLVEWRGEADQNGDDEVEEIIREVIVIDDEDDDRSANIPACSIMIDSDEDDSDESVKITYRPAVHADLGAERHDEQSIQFLDRYQHRADNHRDANLRTHIENARQHIRRAQARSQVPPVRSTQLNVPSNQLGNDTIVVDGRVYRKTPVVDKEPAKIPQPPLSMHSGRETVQAFSWPADTTPSYVPSDRPVPSIENGNTTNFRNFGQENQAGAFRAVGSRFADARIANGNEANLLAHRNHGTVDLTLGTPSPSGVRDQGLTSPPQGFYGRFVDLTMDTPPRPQLSQYVSATEHTRPPFVPNNVPPVTYSDQRHATILPSNEVRLPQSQSMTYREAHGSILNQRQEIRHQPVSSGVAPVQYIALQPRMPQQQAARPRDPLGGSASQPQVVYVRPVHSRPLSQSAKLYSAPAHGAPAPIQLMPRVIRQNDADPSYTPSDYVDTQRVYHHHA